MNRDVNENDVEISNEDIKLEQRRSSNASTDWKWNEEEDDKQVNERCIIHPDGELKILWDAFILLTLIVSSVIIPLVFAFDFKDNMQSPYGILLFAVDICLCIDVAITFRTAYYDQYNRSALVTSPRMIACKYLKGWFLFDIITSFPFQAFANEDSGSGYSYYDSGKGFRFIRVVVQISKMLRMRRTARMHSFFGFDAMSRRAKFWLHLIAIFFAVLLYVHDEACAWFWIGNYVAESGRYSWVIKYDIYGDEVSFWEKYSKSFYWSVVTLFGVGYGDITATNVEEEWMCVFLIFGGSLFSAYFLGVIVGELIEGDKLTQLEDETLQKVNEFCGYYNLKGKELDKLRREMVSHVKYYYEYNQSSLNLDVLPYHIQTKIKLTLSNSSILLRNLDIFNDLDNEIIGQLVLAIRSIACHRGDFLFKYKDFADRMFIQRTGYSQLFFRHRIEHSMSLKRGDVCGEYCLISDRRLHSLSCLSWSEFYVLTKEAIENAILGFYTEKVAERKWENMQRIIERQRTQRKVRFAGRESMYPEEYESSDVEPEEMDSDNEEVKGNAWTMKELKQRFKRYKRTTSENRNMKIAAHYKK